MLNKLSRIDITEFLVDGEKLLDRSLIEGAYVSADDFSLELELFDKTEIQAAIKIGSSGYTSFCSLCGEGRCSHIAALIIFYKNDRSYFDTVEELGVDFFSLAVKKFELQSKSNKTGKSLVKKFKRMLEGLSLAKALLLEVLKLQGAGERLALQNSIRAQFETLGALHLSGIQLEFTAMLQQQSFESSDHAFLTGVNKLYTIINQSEKDLIKAIEDNLYYMPYSTLMARCGYVWKYSELKYYSEPIHTDLIQLNFNVSENLLSQRLEEMAIWLDLNSGDLYFTQNLRPFKALRYIPESNTEFNIINAQGLVKYPGDYNSRVKWQSESKRAADKESFRVASSLARHFDTNEFKKIKASLRDGFTGISPYSFFQVEKFTFSGKRVIAHLGDHKAVLSLSYETEVLKHLMAENLLKVACLFRVDLKHGELALTPLCVLGEDFITRLGF